MTRAEDYPTVSDPRWPKGQPNKTTHIAPTSESVPVLSADPLNEYDPKHPHERQETPIPPALDPEGRCLVCGLIVRAEAAETRAARYEAAILEGDRIIERLRERIHPTMDGYCPECGGGCLIGFATPTPARTAARAALTSEAHRG